MSIKNSKTCGSHTHITTRGATLGQVRIGTQALGDGNELVAFAFSIFDHPRKDFETTGGCFSIRAFDVGRMTYAEPAGDQVKLVTDSLERKERVPTIDFVVKSQDGS